MSEADNSVLERQVTDDVKRVTRSHWYPGMKSPNPGGRPKATARLSELAREHTAEALGKIVALMNDPKSSRMMQLACARELLDRGYGRPAQCVDMSIGAEPAMADEPGMFDIARRMAFTLAAGLNAPRPLLAQKEADPIEVKSNAANSA